MKKNLAAASVLALVLATAGVAGISLRSTGSAAGSSSPVSSTSSVVAEGAAPVVSRGERDLRLGRSFTYDVKASRMLGTGEVAKLDGRLVLTVVGAAEGGAAVRAELVSGANADGLATPFFFVLQPNGAVGSFGFAKAMPGEARRVLRSVVSSLQIVVAAQPAWEAHEADVAGELVASYTRSGNEIEKLVTRYERIRTPNGLVTPSEIGGTYETRGGSHVELDASGWPSVDDENVTVTATFEAMKLAMTGKTDAHLVAQGIDRTHVGSYDAARAGFDPDVDALAEGAALAQRNADANLVAGATLPALIGDLDGDVRGRSRAVAKMGALLRTSPEAVRDARHTLLAKGTPERTANALASALGKTGTPEAQDALADAMKSADTAASTKNEAAISLGLTEKPTTEAKDALAKGAKSADPELAETSSLALGNLARAAQGTPDGDDAVAMLLARLEASTSPAEKALALDALGNSGDPRAVDAILASVGDASSVVRGAAIRALRFVKDERAVNALVAGALDPDASVRMGALAAIGQQSVGPFLQVLGHVVTNDADVNVRLLAVRVLARSVNLGGDIESVLATVAAKDADEKVRDAAAQALSKPTAPITR